MAESLSQFEAVFERMPSVAWIFRPTTFGEIFAGIVQGGAYAFDDTAYERFHPLAGRRGLALAPPEPPEPPPGCSPEDHLVHVRYKLGEMRSE